MTIKYNWQDLQKRIINGREVEKVMYNGVQIRPSSTPPTPTFDDYLYFQIQPQGTCYLSLRKQGNPTDVSLEISYDKQTWTDYSVWSDIEITQLTNIYFRNKSETPTWFSRYVQNIIQYYYFHFEGDADVYCWWDVTSLLCKNWATTLIGSWCFASLFHDMPIITAPELPATTLTSSCYYNMFGFCRKLTTAPELPAITLATSCYEDMFITCESLTSIPLLPALSILGKSYYQMFAGCTNIKLSETQTWDYQNEYRIPYAGSGTTSSWTSLYNMFMDTWWTFTGTPNINQMYYTSNTVI